MKFIYFILLTTLVFSNCTTNKSIVIKHNKKSKELEMYIDPTIKSGGLGLLLIKPIGIFINFTELIKKLTVFDSNDNLLWTIESKDTLYGGHNIQYGKVNTNEYKQVYPLNGSPTNLERHKQYKIVLQTEKSNYIKKFIFQESIIYLKDDDFKID